MGIKLQVTEIPEAADELQIRTLFEKYGNVRDVKSSTKTDIVFIEMDDVQAAQKAMTHLNNYSFLDQKIRVKQALIGSTYL